MSATSTYPSAESAAAAHSSRVLLWGTYDTGKPRIRILSRGIAEAGLRLDAIHADLWGGIEDKSQARGISLKLRLFAKALTVYPPLVWRLFRAPRPDVIVVSYPGVLDAVLAGAIGKLRRIPVAFDVFISLYDTVVEDRQLFPRSSLRARLLRWIERVGLRSADFLFMDTAAHARRLENLFDLPTGTCGHAWVGVESDVFRPLPSPVVREAPRAMSVLFYGQYIPLHGIPFIIAAARLLRDLPIEWTLIGQGQESANINRLMAEDPLPRLTRIPWVDYASLCRQLAGADLCLGIFGTSEKATSVIPNKVFQIVAAGRPMVTRDSPAIRELFPESREGMILVDAGSPEALAAAVRAWYEAGDWKLARCFHADLAAKIDAAAVGRQFSALLATWLRSRSSS